MNPQTRLIFWLGKQLAFPPLEFADGGKRKALPPGSSAWAKFARWFGEIQPDDEAGLSAGSAALDAINEHLRDCVLAFNVQVVDPVRAPAEQCRKLIGAAVESARLEEERAPLHNVGLEEVMRQAVRDVAKVRWNDDVGLILIGAGDEGK